MNMKHLQLYIFFLIWNYLEHVINFSLPAWLGRYGASDFIGRHDDQALVPFFGSWA